MCVNTNGSFVCECPPGFEGDNCLGKQSINEPKPTTTDYHNTSF